MAEGFLLTAIVMLVAMFFIDKPFGKISFTVTFVVTALLQLLTELLNGPEMQPIVPTISIVGLLAILLDVAMFHGLLAAGHGLKRLLRKKG